MKIRKKNIPYFLCLDSDIKKKTRERSPEATAEDSSKGERQRRFNRGKYLPFPFPEKLG
jgi:hypothetical protein